MTGGNRGWTPRGQKTALLVAKQIVEDIARRGNIVGDKLPPEHRMLAVSVLSVLLESLVERHEEKIVMAGTANLAAVDFAASLREVLEALEENMVLIRLLGEVKDPSMLTVSIGQENFHEGLRSTSVVSADYGVGNQSLAKIGVVGPTRMDYPGTMGAVRAVARYVGQILAGQ